jgi:NAD(P)-dependent dehydrogenase (short-subunit alcohol dehydrogenase family)
MDLGLRNKVVVLSGGSLGIGYACAHLFGQEGARLAIAARDPRRLEEAAKRIHEETGADALPIPADMSNTEDVKRFVAASLEHYGRIDALVNVAGSAPGGLLENLTDEQWFEALNLKFMGYVRTIREVAPIMIRQGGGRILNLIGNDGNKPAYWEVVPSAANAAGHRLTQALAEQYARHNILINAVNPGPVATQRWDGLEKAMARDKNISQQQAHQLALKSLPLGRICTPEEVARLVVFLCSEANTYVTGALVPIDGAQRKALMDV